MNKEGFIEDITRKLSENVQLNRQEISTIVRALRESEHCFQEPYYEVIYHDKYDNTETRIMNPVDSKITQMSSGELVQDDRFDLRFRRLIKSEDNKVKNPMEQTLDFFKNLYLQNKEEIDRVAKEYKVIEADKAESKED